jgi:hypothetical protein
MKKYSLVLILIIISLFHLVSSEIRMGGMAGISYEGFYVIPDQWADPFYVNPALGVRNKIGFSRSSGEFSINPYHYKDDTNFDIDIDGDLTGRWGLMVPLKNDRLFAYDGFIVTEIGGARSIDSGNVTSEVFDSAVRTMHNLVYAQRISDLVSFGYRGRVGYDFSATTYGMPELTSPEKEASPFTLSLENRWGLLIDLPNNELGVTFLLDYSHKGSRPSSAYDPTTDSWDRWEQVSDAVAGVDLLWVIPVNQRFRLRVQHRHRVRTAFDYTTFVDGSGDALDTTSVTMPQSGAVTFIHPVNERLRFHYGVDTEANLSLLMVGLNQLATIIFDWDVSLFGGFEVEALPNATFRAGLRTRLINLNWQRQLDLERNSVFFDIPLSIALQAGCDIRMNDRLTFQLNAGMLFANLDFTYNDGGPSPMTRSNFRIDLSGGFLLKSKRQLETASESDA